MSKKNYKHQLQDIFYGTSLDYLKGDEVEKYVYGFDGTKTCREKAASK